MAVTITPTANTAYDSDIMFSGSLAISGALADNSETLNISVYNTSNGATFLGVPKTYDGTSTVTYNYPNGTVLTVNLSTSEWTYQRLNTELNSTNMSYVFTFDFKGSTTTTATLTVAPVRNITITDFSADDLDDLDTKVTGTCDITILDGTGQTIKVDVSVNGTEMQGTAQPITSLTGAYTFTYSDSTSITVDLGTKKWTYNRLSSSVGNGDSDNYNFNISFGLKNISVSVSSYVGYQPSITQFTVTPTLDTDAKVLGALWVDNIANSTIQIDVTHNNIKMIGMAQAYMENNTITWTYSDTSTLIYDTTTNAWEYNRIQSDKEDLREDTYTFDIEITSRYGSDNGSITVETTIPSANILGFSAEGITDTEPIISGVLQYTLPTVATSPTMQVNVVSNGTQYVGIPIALDTATDIEFTFGDSSKFEVDPVNGTFTFTRSADDTEIVANDTYNFTCIIIANGQRVEKSLTVKTYSTVRNYDYQPAYPVHFYAGSPEAENTAWAKYIEEIKRIYRLYNENMNYYESVTKGVTQRMDELENMITVLTSGLATNKVGVILPYVGKLEDIPDGWHLCDGTHGTPNLKGYFLQGTGINAGRHISAGLPNITGRMYLHHVVEGDAGAFVTPSYEVANLEGGGYYYSHIGHVYFDASSSSSVYGKSNTVQPPAYTVYYIMRVDDEA